MKTSLTLLLLTLAYPSLASAQDTLEWRCINGRCGWYRVSRPMLSSPVRSVAISEAGYQTFAVEPARVPISFASYQTPAIAVQASPVTPVTGTTCNCSVTGVCTCPVGTCACPSCANGSVRVGGEYETFTIEPAMGPQVSDPLAIGEAAHTPMSEVVRVIGLLPKPEIAFIDFGCGYDARWCVAAAEKWKCKCVGIENNPFRARAARERIRNLGLDHLITISDGDAATVPVSGDVAVAYLYPSVLTKLTPRLKRFKAFASYLHQPPGMSCTKNGDTWFYQPQAQLVSVPQSAVWRGAVYNQPLCTSPNCAMCNSIRWQLGYR